MANREPFSAVIITRNAARQLGACLQSVAFADEIVVVDSGSTDETVEMARQYGAQVLHQDWLGYGLQKQFAIEQAAHDWVLCLDADERVSTALQGSIEAALSAPRANGYLMPRCNRFLGRWLRHGEGYPDWSLRLFRRSLGRWSDDVVHEKVVVQGAVERLQGDLLHESAEDLQQYLAKQESYTTLQAEIMQQRGKRSGLLQMWFSPLFRFVKFYFLRLGFLDGWAGLVHIAIGCQNSFNKYAKLREMQRNV